MTTRRGRTTRPGVVTKLGGPRGIVVALALAIAGILVALLCVRAMIGETLVNDSFGAEAAAAPRDPDAVLAAATQALVAHYGHLDDATHAAVRRAAVAAPLDARPYLIFGHQQLLDREPDRALATLLAGQRLDPRQPLIHILLLDRYLRTGRYALAAPQMSVLARLNGSTEAPIATAFAALALAPQTRPAVLQTLRRDPVLEQGVLTALAKGGVAPATIFALASPAALAAAGQPDGWGPALVTGLIGRHRYAEARAVWQRVYKIDTAAAAPAIFDAAFAPSPAAPPFAWTLTGSSLGAADIRGSGLALDYYGRDSGELASQMLVLAPGAYRFAFTVDPGKSDASSHLLWTLTCVGGDKPVMTAPINPGPSPRRLVATFTVPAGCAAQQLAVRGEAGDIPTPLSITVRSPEIAAAGATQP